MPTKIEKDAISGQDTTGHEWDGMKELNTPLPKWWLYVFMACIVWAFGMFVLYPSIPYGTGYFHGLLGYSQRASVDAAWASSLPSGKSRWTRSLRCHSTPSRAIRR